MGQERHYFLFWCVSGLLLVAVSLLTHTLLPIDETRYMGVAWEMWDKAEFLVPMINGEPYSHKPPLLFWLIEFGWWLFGVNDWWPRLVATSFSLASVFLTGHVARLLWPDKPVVARLAPTILIGSSLWAAYTPAIMFDVILSFWVLLAVAGMLTVLLSNRRRGWTVFAVATGLGILTKGPVMALQVLPLALLMPYCSSSWRGRRSAWYGWLAFAFVMAVGIALAWAIPAALHGGEDYAKAIFLGQTSGRLVDSFAHQRAWWWYLPVLPAILFPWLAWPPLWHALLQSWRSDRDDWTLRLCCAWIFPVLLIFMLVSGKQAHYLLPLFPAFALLTARTLTRYGRPVTGLSQWLIGICIATIAVLLLLLPSFQARYDWPLWIAQLSPYASMALLLAIAAALFPLRKTTIEARVVMLAGVSIASFNIVMAAVFIPAQPYYDLRQTSAYLQKAQQQDIAIATIGKYHNQFQFYGRLHQAITVIKRDEALEWAAAHRDGQVISIQREIPRNTSRPLFKAPYRGLWIMIWPADILLRQPELLLSG